MPRSNRPCGGRAQQSCRTLIGVDQHFCDPCWASLPNDIKNALARSYTPTNFSTPELCARAKERARAQAFSWFNANGGT